MTGLTSLVSKGRRLAGVGLMALSLGGCLSRSPAEVTGSIGVTKPVSESALRQQSEAWGQRFEANPADANAALNYARSLRSLDQKMQAAAVLQQATIRNPRHMELLAAYGKALTDVGRLEEAKEVLKRAHTPERPDWRILSAQGAVSDQMGDHETAQRYYEAALKLKPNEASILSNLGLSYALSKHLPEAERSLRQAADQPEADIRVRQNLALIFGLQGKFQEAETVLKRDLPPDEAAANLAVIRKMVSQPNSWKALRQADGTARSAKAKQAAKPEMSEIRTESAPL